MADARVSVVAPVYNNAATLAALCRRTRAAFGPEPVEIILVDDGSTDDSRAVMERLDARAIGHDGNRGQNQAILTGLRAATGETCCVLDADLEDPPEGLPALVAALGDRGVGVAFSSRAGHRPLTSRLFRRALRALFPTLPRHACLCFAIDRATRDHLLAAATDSDYLVAVIGAMGVPTAEVPIVRGRREAGRSGYAGPSRYVYAMRQLRSALGLRRRDRGRSGS